MSKRKVKEKWWVVLANFGFGWVRVSAETDRFFAREVAKAYPKHKIVEGYLTYSLPEKRRKRK